MYKVKNNDQVYIIICSLMSFITSHQSAFVNIYLLSSISAKETNEIFWTCSPEKSTNIANNILAQTKSDIFFMVYSSISIFLDESADIGEIASFDIRGNNDAKYSKH